MIVHSKTIPPALLAHYQQDGTTLANLLRMELRSGSVAGLTNLDIDFPYDDGAGEVVYSSTVGMDPYPMEQAAGLTVDNSEIKMLFAESGTFTPQSLAAGALDYGHYVVYRINFLAPEQGFEILDVGTIGVVRNIDGLSGMIELRSLQQLLKQNYGRLYSRTCRAVFGSGGGGTCVGFGQCGYDAESLWQNGTVASVGAEADLYFTGTPAPTPVGSMTFAPGVVRWLTGENAGATSEIDIIDGGDFTLRYPTHYPIAVSDTFKARPDCDKLWTTCRDTYANQLRFRGEPFIPIGDEGSQATPDFTGTWAPTQTVLPEDTP